MNHAISRLGLPLLLSLLSSTAPGAALHDTATNQIAPRSVFLQPANPRQGRDPFFPESTRPYATAAVAFHTSPRLTLVVKGFSGTVGDRTVIINDHSFAEGDEGDVTVPGGRVHLRCLMIKANSVVVEANHQRREIGFTTE